MEENLCMTCGTLDFPDKRHKGTVRLEAALLIVSILAAVINLFVGAMLFIVFVIYCLWRLTTKHFACGNCDSVHIIPVDSPVARNFIAQTYENNN